VINDKWVILEFIARGGMGEVYRAHQLNLKRDVVIKVISSEWLESCEDDSEELASGLQRFRNEVQAMAQIRHPNIVQVYDHGSLAADETHRNAPLEYIVMEYIPGGTLRATMREEGFHPEEDETRQWLRRYFRPLLDGVEAIHRTGMTHRDLKPENVLMDGDAPKIVDFGLVRSCRLKSVTQSLDVKGTPPYMSPEQFFDFGRVDHRADIYSLGKMLYEAVDGKMTSKIKPFNSIGLSDPSTPFFKALDHIIRKATAEDIEERFESAAKLRQALQEAIEETRGATPADRRVSGSEGARDAPPAGRFSRKSMLWMVLAGVAVITAAFFFWMQGHMTKTHKGQAASQGTRQADHPPVIPSRPANRPETSAESLPATIRAEDGMILHLATGGPVAFPRGWGPLAGKKTRVNSFFMDETPVTNHQYVEFLNQLLLYVQVKNAVVRSGERILMMLGEVWENYEPIVFKDGKFHMNDPMHSSCPVLRVTAYGASAFARYYGRRLPTATEWLYAIKKGAASSRDTGSDDTRPSGKPATDMPRMVQQKAGEEDAGAKPGRKPTPVMLLKANSLGIRGLNSEMGEWGLRITAKEDGNKQGRLEYIVLGAFGQGPRTSESPPSLVPRHPWEAFEEVGFRTVIGMGNSGLAEPVDAER
jgi:serine/threonine-protein kinase